MTQVYAVVLCGGRGERFWPRSRRSLPKQFLSLFGRSSLLEETSRRILPICPLKRQLFIAPAEFRPILRRQLGSSARLVFEPVGRNTAPAIGLAAAYLKQEAPDATMIVLPADHLITDRTGFTRAVRIGAALAARGLLVTFGISPDRPDTGYGYIELGQTVADRQGVTAHQVLEFKEKPGRSRAQAYVAAGNYVWNSGMFMWRVDAIMAAFKQFLPDFSAELERFSKAVGTRQETAAKNRLYRDAASISIDYAVMEKADNVICVRGRFDWDDVGSWPALFRHMTKDDGGNVVNGLFVQKESSRCVVDADSGLVAALGVSDLVIVRAGNAVLVAHQRHLGRLKELLAALAARPGADRFL